MENTDFCGSWCIALTCHKKFILPPWQAAKSLPRSSCAGQQGTYKLVFVTDKTANQKRTLNSRNTFRVITKVLKKPPLLEYILQRVAALCSHRRGGGCSGEARLGGTECRPEIGRWFPLLWQPALTLCLGLHMKPNSSFPCSPTCGIWPEFKTPHSRLLGEYLSKHTTREGEPRKCNTSRAGAKAGQVTAT